MSILNFRGIIDTKRRVFFDKPETFFEASGKKCLIANQGFFGSLDSQKKSPSNVRRLEYYGETHPMASKMKPLFQGLLSGKKNSWSGKIQVDHDRLHIPSQPAQVLEKSMKILYYDIFLKIHDLSSSLFMPFSYKFPCSPCLANKHWRPPAPLTFRTEDPFNTCNSTRDLPGNTHNFEKRKETHPTWKWNQMIFNQKYLSHLMYWAQFFRSFKDIRKPTQANPPWVQRKPRRPQLLRSKGPRGPTAGKTKGQGAKKTKS